MTGEAQDAKRLARENARLERETARLERENRRLRRQTDQAKAQLVRQRGLGRLGPEALAAALDELRAQFVADGATASEALALCAELEALARGDQR